MTDQEDGSFLGRWSRLKHQAKTGPVETPARPEPGPAPPARPAPTGERPAESAGAETSMLTEADFADVDFAALDASSDYSRFMASNVPDAIRRKALQKLWTTDPLFTSIDPCHDYHGDYTDAAVAVGDSLKTAYRVGRGFLDDKELAEWENLGKPEAKPPAKADLEPTPAKEAAPAASDGDGAPPAASDSIASDSESQQDEKKSA